MSWRSRSGMTLLEVIISVGIVAVMILALALLFTRLLGASNKEGDLAVGVSLAQRVLDQRVLGGIYDQSTANITTSLYSHGASLATEFTYRATSTAIAMPSAATSYELQVDVWWFDSQYSASNSTRDNLGILHAHSERLVTP